MALVYFDTSALVKLLDEEPGSDLVSRLWDACDRPITSRLAYPEVCSALAGSHRSQVLSAPSLKKARAQFDRLWNRVSPIELRPVVQHRAGNIACDHRLRGADAVHLASALALPAAHTVMAVWDRRLATAAVAEGLRVVPS